MCKGKAEGGKRCTAHSVGGYKKAIASKTAKNKEDRVKEKARDILLTPNADKPFIDNGNTMVATAKQKAATAAKKLSSLQAIKKNRVILADNHQRTYEHVGMTITEANEYDKLESDAQKESWHNHKLEEATRANVVIEQEWRANPRYHYDRVALPREHDHMLSDRSVDPAYIKCIAITTTDKATRTRALARLAKTQGVDAESLDREYPSSIETPRQERTYSEPRAATTTTRKQNRKKSRGFLGTIIAFFTK